MLLGVIHDPPGRPTIATYSRKKPQCMSRALNFPALISPFVAAALFIIFQIFRHFSHGTIYALAQEVAVTATPMLGRRRLERAHFRRLDS